MSLIAKVIYKVLSISKRIDKMIHKNAATPEPLEDLPPKDLPSQDLPPKDLPPQYECIDSHPICKAASLAKFASFAPLKAIDVLSNAKDSQEGVMIDTIDAFESAMKWAFTELQNTNVSSDSVKVALLVATEVAALASIRGLAISEYADNLCMNGPHGRVDHMKTWLNTKDSARSAGMDAGMAVPSDARQLDDVSTPRSEMDAILSRVALNASTVVVLGIVLGHVTQSRMMMAMVDALDSGIRAGMESGVPFNHSLAVFRTALSAAVTAGRSYIMLMSPRRLRFQPDTKIWKSEATNEAIETGIRAGIYGTLGTEYIHQPHQTEPPAYQ
ncbi:hypothetical protein F4777DRAFT_583592 [Nemania sp. FL0916]|nr:hypothetical protein F4777DRAFT_583592 [Nemania sp. FL0916]